MTNLIFNGREIDTREIEFGYFDYRNENPWLEKAYYMDGQALTDSEMDDLADDMASELHMIFMDKLY